MRCVSVVSRANHEQTNKYADSEEEISDRFETTISTPFRDGNRRVGHIFDPGRLQLLSKTFHGLTSRFPTGHDRGPPAQSAVTYRVCLAEVIPFRRTVHGELLNVPRVPTETSTPGGGIAYNCSTVVFDRAR